MVCLGNICRSPLAQGVMEQKIKKYNLTWEVDSAGTSGYHDGEKPDARAIKVAKDKGLSIEKQISRKITKEDLYYYNLICVMDAQNYNEVKRFSQLHQTEANIELLLNLVYPGQNRQVPDPYYDGKFEEVYNMLDIALEKFVASQLSVH